MATFREEHAPWFFGRDRVVSALYEKIQAKSVVAVVGASGSGKSSLVFAGLLPRLKVEGWLFEDCRPRTQPFYVLAEAFVRLLEPSVSGSELVKQSIGLSELIQQRGITEVIASLVHRYPGRSLLLIVDQFEELFTPDQEEQGEHFLKILLDGVTKAVGLKLVVTLRADFCGQAYGDRTLTDAFQDAQLLIGPMTSVEFRAAIEQPAKLSGLELEPGLIDRLLHDVGQETGNLPLLEFALTQLWERQENGRLTHQAYTAIQEIKGALAQHADQVFASLTKEQQQQAPQAFTKMVRIGVGTEDTRKVATRSEVGDWELVTVLASQRLVVTGWDEQRGEETVELIHEALIREWKLLRQWVDENRNFRQLVQTVEDAWQIWQKRGKRKDLLDGRLLKDAKYLLKKRVDVQGELRSFVQKSLKWRRSQMAGLLAIPTLVLGIPTEYFWREEAIKRDSDQIAPGWAGWPGQRGEREIVISLTKGCWAMNQLPRVPDYLAERIFGNCRPLFEAKLEKVELISLDLSGAYLANSNLSGAYLTNSNLNRANLNRSNLSRTHLGYSNLSEASLVSANLSEASLESANLSEASLVSANLSGASLVSTDLSGASLVSANLGHVKFNCLVIKVVKDRPVLDCPNLKDIKWSEKTNWQGIQGWESVENIPPKLKEQLKLKNTK